MKKMLKVMAVAMLTVSMMVSMAMNVSAEEAIEAVVETIVEEQAFTEEAIAEESTEEAVIEEVVEEAAVEEAVVEEAPVRTVSFTFSWDGDEVTYGDEIKLVPILDGYEGADYELVWQHSTDNANWIDYTTGDASYTLTEENVSWYWRLVVNTVEEQAA